MANSEQKPDVTKKYYSMTRVCSGSKESVRVLKIRGFFELAKENTLHIPIFQRRYCWDSKNWSKLLQDILKQTSSKRNHGFNRMQTARQGDRVDIIDGQQRLTTFSIFLAAVRDVYSNDTASVAEINSLLFPGGVPEPIPELQEGVVLGSAVVPSYFDRLPFYFATLPGISPPSHLDDQITQTYIFFCNNLLKFSSNLTASQLTSALLDKCTMLNFQVSDKNTMEVYELMAVHNHVWGGPGGKAMAETDLIKNFLLSQFEAEATQVQFYTSIWLQMEQLLVSGNDQTGTFDKLFRAFLVKQGLERASGSDNKFDLYNDVQKAVYDFVASAADVSSEEAVFQFLNRLLAFCKKWKSPINQMDEESNFLKSA